MPFEKIPVLSIDGHMLPQSYAIARYLAREFGNLKKFYENTLKEVLSSGYAGKTPLEEATVDALADLMKDFFTETRPFYDAYFDKVPIEELEKLKSDLYKPALEKTFNYYEKYLKESKSGKSKRICWRDFEAQDSSSTLEWLGLIFSWLISLIPSQTLCRIAWRVTKR